MRLCPHCGYSLDQDTPIEIGPWVLTPVSVRLHGVMTSLSKGEAMLLYTLAKAAGRPLHADVLAARVCVDSVNPNGLLRVMLWKVRKKLGSACTISAVPGAGYFVEFKSVG